MSPKDYNRLWILLAWIGIIIILLCSCGQKLPQIWEIKNIRVTEIDSAKTFLERIGIEKQAKWIYTGVQIPTERFWLRTCAAIDSFIHVGDTVIVKFNGLEVKLKK